MLSELDYNRMTADGSLVIHTYSERMMTRKVVNAKKGVGV